MEMLTPLLIVSVAPARILTLSLKVRSFDQVVFSLMVMFAWAKTMVAIMQVRYLASKTLISIIYKI